MKRLTFLGILGCFCFFGLTILASVPNLINYQGRLTDAAGSPITTATTVRFSLYQGGSAGTPGSGTLVYEEDASVIPDSNGVFDHTIGSGTVVYGTLDSTVFQTSSPVYLEITVDPAGVSDTLLPRKQVVSVGYSFKSELADDADTVDGLHAADFALIGHHHDADYVNEGQADSVTSSMIVNGTIMNADINPSANIAASKINTIGLDADLLDGKDSLDFVHTTGDDMTGTLNVNTSTTWALWGTTSSTSGYGVYGYATATSGNTYGVYGQANKYGVYGYATCISCYNYGLYGRSDSTSGTGVYGFANATSGTTSGVHGESNSTSGRGVIGSAIANSGFTIGVYGGSESTTGRGVYGHANATSGINYGVFGSSISTDGTGVFGEAGAITGTNYGVFGYSRSSSGYGLYGTAPTFAVFGLATATSGTSYGVYGRSDSNSGYGVRGTAPTYAVYGFASASSGTNYGVYGESGSTSGRGVYGEAPYMGVQGLASATTGTNYAVRGWTRSSNGYGVYGYAPTGGSGFAVYANGNAHVTGNLTVGGSKPCVQPIDDGKKVLLYAMESPEIWFEDFGTAQLVNGQAVVQIERVFAQTSNIEMGYLVFLTPNGECQGLYISRKDRDSFEVRELRGGTSNITFDYRIVAKRRGYEDVRFEEFTEPEKSPEEPNLPIEPKEAKVKHPQRQ